jgi:hypothetical protein
VVTLAEGGLDRGRGGGANRHRHVELVGGLEAEVEVLAQQDRGEGRREIEVDERR